MTVRDPAPRVTATPGARPRPGLALLTISAAQLLFLLDATVVNIALPTIRDALGFDDAGLQWVVAAYSVAFGGLLLLGGRTGDLLGLRRTFMAGLLLFMLASLGGGLAPDRGWLVVCRALQGIGAAAASPAALSLIAATFAEGEARNRALGVYTAVAGVGGPLGLVAGGLVTTYLSWRWVLLVNVPICLVVLVLAPRALPESAPQRGRVDALGAVTGTLGVTALVYGFVRAAGVPGSAGRWGDPAVLALFAVAVLLLAIFCLVEHRADDPLVPLRFLADRGRSGTLVALALISTAMFGVYFFMTLYLQQVWGYSALQTALVYVPLSLILMAGARISSTVVGRTGPRPLVLAGLAAAAIGLFWLSRIGHGGGLWTGLLLPTTVTYAGFGITSVPLTLTALHRVAPGESGLASGLFNTARQVGGALGLSVLGTVALAGSAGLGAGVGLGFTVAAVVTVAAAVTVVVTMARGSGASVDDAAGNA